MRLRASTTSPGGRPGRLAAEVRGTRAGVGVDRLTVACEVAGGGSNRSVGGGVLGVLGFTGFVTD